MFKRLEGWSIRVFAGKVLKRAVAPLTGILVAWFTRIAPDTISTQGAETAQIAAGFIVAILVELARNLITYAANKAQIQVGAE